MFEWPKKHPVLAILLLLAIVGRVAFEGVYIDFNQDKARQLFIAQVFTEGGGFSFCTADLTDLSRVACERIRFWAIGYPLVLAIVDRAVGDYVQSSVLIDAFGVIALVWALHLLLRQVGVSGRAYGLFMVFTALTFTPYFQSGSTDMISAGLYILAVAWTLRAVEETDTSPRAFAAIGVTLFLTTFFRYFYYPFVLILPVFLLLSGIGKKRRNHIIGAGIVLLSSALPLACLLGFYQHYFGSALYVKGTATLYPENLAHIAPFPLDSLIFTPLLEDNIQAYIPVLSALVRPVAWGLSLAIIALVVGHLVSGRRRGSEGTTSTVISSFHFVLLAVMLLNVAILVYYSLKIPPARTWIEFWTYVQERRYYAPTMLLIQVAVVSAWSRRSVNPKWIWRGLDAVALMALLFSVSYGVYRAVKVHVLEAPTLFDHRTARVARIGELIGEVRREGHDRIVYADGISVHDTCLVALQCDARIVLEYEKLISTALPADAPTVLLISMPRDRSEAETALIDSAEPRLVLAEHNSDIFRFDLPLKDSE
jgi:hypothetical protein